MDFDDIADAGDDLRTARDFEGRPVMHDDGTMCCPHHDLPLEMDQGYEYCPRSGCDYAWAW